MPAWICATCAVQYPDTAEPPVHCPICEDERQYVGWTGQRWTDLDRLRSDHRNRIEQQGPGLWGIGTEPSFAIGQRALLLDLGLPAPPHHGGPGGNILWDCISLLDDDTVAFVEDRGGLRAIAVSHPHYYGTMVEWSRALGGVPVFIHERDREWITRPDSCIELWSGETMELAPGVTLVNLAVHFDGGTVLHWAGGDEGSGALLSGDIVQVVMDRRWVGFMRSYPNLIPERPETILRACELLAPLAYRRIYGAWWGRIVDGDGPGVVTRSAERYLRWVGWPGRRPAPTGAP
jgi:hypothetical protein